ncbi:unnamed protein product [Gulo gulo]|uniref:Uncharacterized protein n=1 Tax=Gulo gulo TaxID=48420 RepID=A0A9X9Q3R6_GULGU|nr:unnamed protein product [Gulo gulo]
MTMQSHATGCVMQMRELRLEDKNFTSFAPGPGLRRARSWEACV